MREVLEEIQIKGTSISEGVAIGKLLFLEDFSDEIIPEFPIRVSDIENEISRYRRAVFSSRADLHDLQDFLAREGSSEAASIIDTHIQMLEDPFMTTFVEKKIRQMMKNTESVFRNVMTDYEKEFSKIKDRFFRQRLLDVKDLSNRILRHLYPRREVKLSDFPDHAIIFAKELVPSVIAEATPSQIRGFITEKGGSTSHAALIARSKGIPYISNIDVTAMREFEHSEAVIDGNLGLLVVNPSSATLKSYKKKKKDSSSLRLLNHRTGKGAKTLDGCLLTLLVNLESIADLDLVDVYRADGIGLFRSEFLFLGKALDSFSEEDQYALYKQVVKKARGKPLTFRILDIGGDKGGIADCERESNPALGCRAIRFLLRYQEIFIIHLRALLRVSLEGNLRILLPLISDVTEVIETKGLIQKVATELRKEGHLVAEEIPLGSMIEVPSAAMTSDFIAKECDFLSIGTNDLTQYTLAADRTNQNLYPFYKPTHPSIIRMIKYIAKEAGKQGIPVNLCGEMAANPLMLPLLLGLGIKSFSVAPRYLPHIRKMVEKLSLAECEDLISEVSICETSFEIEQLLRERYGEIVSEISDEM